MSKSQFEQLIEYVINDEEAKARELFHNIVVEKSRAIYESIMEETDESVEEGVEEDLEEGIEEEGIEEEGLEEGIEEGLGGDASDNLIDSVEADEQMEGEEEGEDGKEFGTDDDFDDADGAEGSSEPATKDDIMDLEMKLDDFMDQLMAEFEGELGGADAGADAAMDASGNMTDLEVADDEFETEGMMEAVTLKAAPKPVTSEEGNINKRSINADNAGAKGPMGSVVKPVHPTGTEAKGRPDPTTKDLIGDFQNKAGGSMKDLKPATKPVTAQASGVNTKSPLAKRG